MLDFKIIKKFCWLPYIILDDYGNDNIKWFGTVYIMQRQADFNGKDFWQDVRFATKEEYEDFIEPFPMIDTSKTIVDLDKLVLLKTIEKRRKINHWENKEFIELLGDMLIQFDFSYENEESTDVKLIASLTDYGQYALNLSYNNLSKEDKKTVERLVVKKLRRKFFWNELELL